MAVRTESPGHVVRSCVALLRRLLSGAITLLCMVAVVFAAVRLVPGDPVDHLLGEQASAAERVQLRTRMHLDGPLHEQFARMLGELGDGTLGTSWAVAGKPVPVRSLIAERLPHTAALAAAAVVLAALLALPLGLMGALWPGRLADHVSRLWCLGAISTPAFVSGPLALFGFAVVLQLAPTPAHHATPWQALWLPALVLAVALSARLARLLRASLLEVLGSDAALAMRARGLSSARILWRHALPGAALPVLTVLGLQLAALLGGAIVTEKVFGRPGLGTLLLEGIASRDHAVVQGCVLVIGAAYLLTSAAVEALLHWLDPRLRAGASL